MSQHLLFPATVTGRHSRADGREGGGGQENKKKPSWAPGQSLHSQEGSQCSRVLGGAGGGGRADSSRSRGLSSQLSLEKAAPPPPRSCRGAMGASHGPHPRPHCVCMQPRVSNSCSPGSTCLDRVGDEPRPASCQQKAQMRRSGSPRHFILSANVH